MVGLRPAMVGSLRRQPRVTSRMTWTKFCELIESRGRPPGSGVERYELLAAVDQTSVSSISGTINAGGAS